jgi:hypothetical protein
MRKGWHPGEESGEKEMKHLPPAVEKTVAEGACRVCAKRDIETAHLWPRGRGGGGYDNPNACVPLCKLHHGQLDAHELELLPYLTLDEQCCLVREAGGMGRALHRVTLSF